MRPRADRHEVKSLRAHKVNLRDSDARIKRRGISVRRAYRRLRAGRTVQPQGNPPAQAADASARDRPLVGYIPRTGLHDGAAEDLLPPRARQGQLGLAKGKKLYDKREAIKRKTARREVERELRLSQSLARFSRRVSAARSWRRGRAAVGASPPVSPSIARSRSIRRRSGGWVENRLAKIPRRRRERPAMD